MTNDTSPRIERNLAAQREQYGDIVPPWVYLPDTHPYSIGWRMGGGEGHLIAWDHWWDAQNFDFDQAIAYFRKWPPPPRWLAWMANVLWNLEPWDTDDPDSFDYTPYFAQLEPLGFGTYADYERDLDDPRWLDGDDADAD